MAEAIVKMKLLSTPEVSLSTNVENELSENKTSDKRKVSSSSNRSTQNIESAAESRKDTSKQNRLWYRQTEV